MGYIESLNFLVGGNIDLQACLSRIVKQVTIFESRLNMNIKCSGALMFNLNIAHGILPL